MNYRKERWIENFVLIMFPVTLLVACTTNGPDQVTTNDLATKEETFSIVQNENPIFYANHNDLKFSKALTKKVNEPSEPMSWSIGEAEDDKYIIISPSMHLAVYKTSSENEESGPESITQTSYSKTNYKESNALNFPDKSVYRFPSDTYDVDKEDLDSLKEHAAFLINNPQFNLTVSGHTDHTGSHSHNQLLSEQRAKLVMEILLTFGAPQSQIIADGYGESVPVNSVDNLEENRRVELEYSRALMLSVM